MAVYGGIGLNAFNKVPTTCLDTIFSEACEGNLAVPLYIEDLLAHICSRMEDHLQVCSWTIIDAFSGNAFEIKSTNVKLSDHIQLASDNRF